MENLHRLCHSRENGNPAASGAQGSRLHGDDSGYAFINTLRRGNVDGGVQEHGMLLNAFLLVLNPSEESGVRRCALALYRHGPSDARGIRSRQKTLAVFTKESLSDRVLSRVPSEICAGRLCRGSGRRSPSKSEREPGTGRNGKTSVKHSGISEPAARLPLWPGPPSTCP